jgi:hypothetical protein
MPGSGPVPCPPYPNVSIGTPTARAIATSIFEWGWFSPWCPPVQSSRRRPPPRRACCDQLGAQEHDGVVEEHAAVGVGVADGARVLAPGQQPDLAGRGSLVVAVDAGRDHRRRTLVAVVVRPRQPVAALMAASAAPPSLRANGMGASPLAGSPPHGRARAARSRQGRATARRRSPARLGPGLRTRCAARTARGEAPAVRLAS